MFRRLRRRWPLAVWCMGVAIGVSGCQPTPPAGTVQDEAKLAGRTAVSFPHAADDYFHDMDGGVALTTDEVRGRNMWIVWSGGNDRFWDGMSNSTFGAFDLLKSISSHPSLGYTRDDRWNTLGLVNEPCFAKAAGGDPARFGLWLDVRSTDCPADPFEDEGKYPGVKTGARGTTFADGRKLPVGSYYGYATGIMGLRLFPNPAFDEKAAKDWDAERYYTDPGYYNRKDLVRPYRIGMSCGFCHVGPSPVHPPADATHPAFADLSSSVGAQYMWVDRLFIYKANQPEGRRNFMYQLAHTFRPGSMDTSLISTDSINNPRTMNAVYDFPSRMGVAKALGHEQLGGGELDNRQFNDFVSSGPLTEFWSKDDATVRTPHVLKDGADSVGLLGALNRVYLNIGLFSEEWLLHFNAIVGGKPITPIQIATAKRNSVYWQATELGTPATALFFLKAARPDHLADAPGGRAYFVETDATVERGKTVFADTCARCHSSKAPPRPAGLDPDRCMGAAYLDCFHRYWAWTQTDDFKTQMRAIVRDPAFLENNYLSTEARIPATLLRTNVCSPLATNALAGNIWNDFSSDTYKSLPSVGTVTLTDAFDGHPMPYAMPAGGRGYTRVPSLISVWSTAPYLLNNSVGPFDPDPSVRGRMRSFDASIQQMLWPERREHDSVLGDRGVLFIDRTTEESRIAIPVGYLPEGLQPLQALAARVMPWLGADRDNLLLGPIPKGVPIGLIANTKLQPEADDGISRAEHLRRLADLGLTLQADLIALPKGASDEEQRRRFANLKDRFLALSKCPDFVVNRGHYFGTAEFNRQDGLSADERSFGREPELTDDDRRSLIAFLKRF